MCAFDWQLNRWHFGTTSEWAKRIAKDERTRQRECEREREKRWKRGWMGGGNEELKREQKKIGIDTLPIQFENKYWNEFTPKKPKNSLLFDRSRVAFDVVFEENLRRHVSTNHRHEIYYLFTKTFSSKHSTCIFWTDLFLSISLCLWKKIFFLFVWWMLSILLLLFNAG